MTPPPRARTRQVKIGKVAIGGGSPVSIQSMANTDTRDSATTLAQIRSLASAGCEIARLAVPDMLAAEALRDIVSQSPLPIVADIHFDYRLALASIKSGVHAIRINPGNIGSADKVKALAEAAGEAGITIRVGSNSGSLPKGLLEAKLKKGLSREDALAESLVDAALEQAKLLESFSFHSIKVSLKASSVAATVAACRRFVEASDYPLHLGVTEAGTVWRGSIKSAVGIGTLLMEGIGDTIRVSLTADPVEEVRTALAILEATGLRKQLPEIVSCPTCGRTEVDLIGLAARVESFVEDLKASGRIVKLSKIAVMGCCVNGPGEAADADLGIAGGKGKFVLFKFGHQVATLSETDAFEELKKEILISCQ